MLHEDRFCGFVLVARWVHMPNRYIQECCLSSWPETSCLALVSSLASGLVTVDLGLNTSLLIGRRWGSILTSLQTLLSRDVRRFWMTSCLCTTKPLFLHDRAWLTVNRSLHVQWLGESPVPADCIESIESTYIFAYSMPGPALQGLRRWARDELAPLCLTLASLAATCGAVINFEASYCGKAWYMQTLLYCGRVNSSRNSSGSDQKELEGKYRWSLHQYWFHMVFKWVNNCTPKICKFGFVALREGDIGGVGLSLYDLSQQLDVFLPPWTFPLHYWSLYSWDSMTASRSRWPSVVILTSSPNTSSASFARSCVFTTRALVPANFWSHWQGSPISSFLD